MQECASATDDLTAFLELGLTGFAEPMAQGSRCAVKLLLMLRRDIVPLGRAKANFNYNLDEKRVLNFENVVNDDDNIKQDISIDVYGRAEKEEEQATDAVAELAKVGE